ncbi:hypothetical protein FC83_GL002315 [Agrilactobacillus composti DSM 18527 = JCM 14202]|uniref:NlpC/P60 domain-containing protein n=1 Tax=Agrilactobacillus composti DSM 18527 = JCM 14202 TaxID=1423734 RepID=X0PIS5_9LACO|nr:NlpC/P60 family protein [Agrilactobacillus composti]KRM33932.1 hypothetical protein FC83_GL002315 [Agrilactobacillus composti DSM 18527 = JCM 14202]GAF42023.1 TolA protein [Agrilactobacillus composti DSM 18527 = JCM 14202]
MSDVVTVTSRKGAKLWNAINGDVLRNLDFGTQWQYFSKSSDEYGVNWYNVGTDEYVTDLEVSESVQSVSQESGVLTVTATGIMAQYSVNGRPWTDVLLNQGEQYQYFTVAVDVWGGYNYDLGGNEWVQGANTNDPANPNSVPLRQQFLNHAVEISTGKSYVLPTDPTNRFGPDYFDCSGLVYTALQYFGINIGSNSAVQYANTTPIDVSELQSGDLVFYGPAGNTHVAIYADNNMVWSAMSLENNPNIGYETYGNMNIPLAEQPFRRITQLGQ